MSCGGCRYVETRTTEAPWSLFSTKLQTFGLGQTIWTDKFWGHLGYFWLIYQHLFLAMFSINQTFFLQKTNPLYPNPKYLCGIWIWAAKNLGVRSPRKCTTAGTGCSIIKMYIYFKDFYVWKFIVFFSFQLFSDQSKK